LKSAIQPMRYTSLHGLLSSILDDGDLFLIKLKPFPFNIMNSLYPNPKGMIYSHTGLRGIAAITIMMGHISTWQPANLSLKNPFFNFFQTHGLAVDFFFILSGFVLNWVYVKSDESFRWSSYARARIARIVPLYFLTLSILVIFPILSLIKHGLKYLPEDFCFSLISSILMLSGIIDGWHLAINHPSWSICVEFFCCLALFPVLIKFNTFLIRDSSANLIFSVLVFASIYLVMICHREHLTMQGPWDYTWLSFGVFGFSSGFFLCTLYRRISLYWRPSLLVINFVCLLVLLIFFLSRFGRLPEQTFLYTCPFLLYFTAFDRGVISTVLKFPFLQWLGERSYSICLWNYPIILIMRPTLGGRVEVFRCIYFLLPSIIYSLGVLSAVLLVSELSFRYFEAPCREYLRNASSHIRTAGRGQKV
jgi:peptidoglycan/LPS O-acetylase OafA/YrhL